MEIKSVHINQMNAATYNPRIDLQPGDEEYETLRESILKFGYIDPIVWNKRTGNIVGGHQRYKILKAEGHEALKVSVVDLDDNDERALNLMLNKSGGDWEEEKLQALLAHLQEHEYDMTYTGFNDQEIDELLNNFYDEQPVEEEDLEDFDPDQEAELITQPYPEPGDIWQLGPHRLIVADSLKEEHMDKLMEGKEADMIFTDPPYNVNYEGWTGLKIQNDKMAKDTFFQFLYDSFTQMFRVLKPGHSIYVCHADTEGVNFRKSFTEVGFKLSQCLVWVKSQLVPGYSDYQWRHEPLLYGWKPGASHRFFGDRTNTTVFDSDIDLKKLDKGELIKIINAFRNEENSTVIRMSKPLRNGEHPTMKPLELIQHYIKNSSKRNELILDPFLGSGSTIIAADQLGRTCYGAELDERYAQVIIERFINFKKTDEEVYCYREGEKIPYHQIMQQREEVS